MTLEPASKIEAAGKARIDHPIMQRKRHLGRNRLASNEDHMLIDGSTNGGGSSDDQRRDHAAGKICFGP